MIICRHSLAHFYCSLSFGHIYRYFVEAGALAVRRVKKEDLTRLARATGGEVYTGCA
jgi:chaperonin GroEL (HSP60 family)